MKSINLNEVKIKEVLLSPGSEIPLQVLYDIIDDAGVVVFTKRIAVKKADMPAQGLTAMTTLVTKITDRLSTLEL